MGLSATFMSWGLKTMKDPSTITGMFKMAKKIK